jgi:hypothetical protein
MRPKRRQRASLLDSIDEKILQQGTVKLQMDGSGDCRLHGKSYGLFMSIVCDSDLPALIASHWHSAALRECSTSFPWHSERRY